MDKGKSCAVLLTDLSKTLDCIVQNFLTAKLEAYGFSYKGVKVMHYYFTDRKYKTKVNDSFNFSPSSIPHLHLRSFLFAEEDNSKNYADDATPYSNGKNV